MRHSQDRDLRQVRSLFISDVHLGCRHSQATEFLDFISRYQPEYLYIVGDFIDGWKLKRRWRWNPTYDQILKRFLALHKAGTKLYYTPGNHDAFLREYLGHLDMLHIVEMKDEFVHLSPGRRRFIVTHGDKYDEVEQNAQWLSLIASIAYDFLLITNRWLNKLCSRSHNPYAFCGAIKRSVKRLVQHVSNFESQLVTRAKERDCDGIICGHIHAPRIANIDSMHYCNTGDWVENCTALVEFSDGSFELVRCDNSVLARLPALHEESCRATPTQTAAV